MYIIFMYLSSYLDSYVCKHIKENMQGYTSN